MPRLYVKQSGSLIGTIADADLQLMVDHLEEEGLTDDDYFMDEATIDILEGNGGSAALVSMLREAVGETEGIDVRWEK